MLSPRSKEPHATQVETRGVFSSQVAWAAAARKDGSLELRSVRGTVLNSEAISAPSI